MNGGDSNLGGPQALPTPPTQLSPTPPSRDSSPILEVPHEGKTSSRPFTIKVETPDDVTSKPEASLDASQTTNDSAPAPTAAPVETTKAEVAPTPAPLAEPSAMPAVDVLPRSEADRGVGAASAIGNGIDNSTIDTATNSTTATTTGAVNATANIAAGAGTIGVSNVGNTSVATGAMGAAGNIEGGVNMGVIAGNGAIPSTGFPANTIANTGVVPGTVVPANAYVDEDIVLNNQPAKKSKKWIIIGVIVALVMVLGGVGVVAVLSGRNSSSESQAPAQFSTKEEVYDALWDFNTWYYSDTINYYENSIGLVPNFAPSEYTLLFPFADVMTYLPENLDNTAQAYAETFPSIPDYLQDGNIDLAPMKTQVLQSIEAMQYNVSIINDFYEAYYIPFTQETIPTTYTKSNKMLSLEQNPETAAVAAAYYDLYCKTVDFFKAPTNLAALQEQTSESTMIAAALLNNLLIETPSAAETLNNLFEEFTK